MLSHDQKLSRLKKACEYGRYEFDDIIQQCREGLMQFWEVAEGVAVTTLMVSGPHRVCYIVAVAGTEAGMKELSIIIDDYAAHHGCEVIRTIGRLGFGEGKAEKIDPAYRPIGIMFEKVVKNG